MRRMLVLIGVALALCVVAAPAVYAVDYPPTVVTQGGKVVSPSTVAGTEVRETPQGSSALPRTGNDSLPLVWIGLTLVGTGAFAAVSFRRRARAS